MQLRLLTVGSLLCGATLTPVEVQAVPQDENVSYSFHVPNCKPLRLPINPKRTALLIANEEYEELDNLKTPIADATALAAQLDALGFGVTLCTNLTSDEIDTATKRYGKAMDRANVNELSVFYFAGHGSQDMLYGIDTPLIPAPRWEPTDIGALLRNLDPDTNKRDSAAVLIIDACRTTEDKQVEGRPPQTGTKVVASPDGSFVVYSTAPGTTASDAALSITNPHSRFAAELMAELSADPTSDVDEMFRRVRLKVKKGSKGKQIPWTSHSLVRKVSFKESKEG